MPNGCMLHHLGVKAEVVVNDSTRSIVVVNIYINIHGNLEYEAGGAIHCTVSNNISYTYHFYFHINYRLYSKY